MDDLFNYALTFDLVATKHLGLTFDRTGRWLKLIRIPLTYLLYNVEGN